jgi:hypothetical protein
MPEPLQHDDSTFVTIERIGDARRPPRDALDQRASDPRTRLARLALILLAAALAGVALLPGGLSAWLPMPDHFIPSDASFAPQTPIAVPARLITTRWQSAPLPPGSPPNGWSVSLSPNDAASLDACATLGAQAADGSALPGPVDVWTTHDAGATWAHVPFPAVTGTGCQVSVTPNEPDSAIVSVFSEAGPGQTSCLNTSFFLTTSGGARWTLLPHLTLIPRAGTSTACEMLPIPHHLFFSMSYSVPSDASDHSLIRRSDDGGTSWVAADGGLALTRAFRPLWIGGNTLAIMDSQTGSSESGATAHLLKVWTTADLGAHWTSAGVSAIGPSSSLLHGATVNPQAPVCACALTASSTGPRSDLSLYLAGVSWQWQRLPPLPSVGATPDKSGVFRVAGFSIRGDPLALGIKPLPYPVTQDAGLGGQSNDDAPRLWEWEVGSQRWKESAFSLPCLAPANCPLFSLGSRVGTEASGARGVWVWLVQTNPAAATALYRTFVPGG